MSIHANLHREQLVDLVEIGDRFGGTVVLDDGSLDWRHLGTIVDTDTTTFAVDTDFGLLWLHWVDSWFDIRVTRPDPQGDGSIPVFRVDAWPAQ
ncbi:hypothetical protein [Marisediminicola sp. LYQ85]|uniref:hypothetical protein n=1 Tax=Marisediminicola sp. LYQ85 TaxID=3391062 RepID=UPI0039838D54